MPVRHGDTATGDRTADSADRATAASGVPFGARCNATIATVMGMDSNSLAIRGAQGHRAPDRGE